MLAAAPLSPARTRLGQLIRSGLVGGLATVVDLLALFILVESFGLDPVLANVPALSLGLSVQFFGNKFWAFDERSTDAASLTRQAGLFALVEVGAFALNAATFHLLVTVWAAPYMLARLLGSGVVYFAFSYPLWAYVFRPARSDGGVPQDRR